LTRNEPGGLTSAVPRIWPCRTAKPRDGALQAVRALPFPGVRDPLAYPSKGDPQMGLCAMGAKPYANGHPL